MKNTIKIACHTNYTTQGITYYTAGNYYDAKFSPLLNVIYIFANSEAVISGRHWTFPIFVAEDYFDLNRLKKLRIFI